MLGRKDLKVGNYMRQVIEPMAQRLGLDYNGTFFEPPVTEAALAFEAYRCGLSLLMSFTYDDGWGTASALGNTSRHKLAKKAAKAMRAGLVEERGRDAISLMACGYGRATAQMWRRTRQVPEHSEHIAALTSNAERSDALAELALRGWPVEASSSVASLREAQGHSIVALDNPGQMIDVRTAMERTQAACEGAAVALGTEYENFSELLIGPIYSMNLELVQGLQTDWVGQMDSWMNLLSDEPVEFGLVAQATAMGSPPSR
jgi:hypothetical protein